VLNRASWLPWVNLLNQKCRVGEVLAAIQANTLVALVSPSVAHGGERRTVIAIETRCSERDRCVVGVRAGENKIAAIGVECRALHRNPADCGGSAPGTNTQMPDVRYMPVV
jgi:hypothetical protein